jgi:hypothetical protein
MEALMNYARQAVLFAMVASFVACSDNSVAPRTESANDDGAYVHGGGASMELAPTQKYTFPMTIDPKHNTTWDLGAGNSLRFPRGSLCDPTKSTYGVGEWEKPCTAASKAVTLQVTVWVDSGGHPRVDFEPSVRFMPSLDPSDWVILTFADLQASLDPFFNINYCPTATSSCYNEALKDPSLATLRDPKTGKITRRIKHFSGYNVAAGEEEGSLMNLVGGGLTLGGARSLSVADLRFQSIRAVQMAYPNMSIAEATDAFDSIRTARHLSGYILASGMEEEQ